MLWGLLKAAILALTCFLLYHEFYRLLKVTVLCRKHRIKCTRSVTLAVLSFSLFIFFNFSFLTELESLLPKFFNPATTPDKKDNVAMVREVYVEKVLDGDTIRLSGGEKVVYMGVNAPELPRGSSWMNEYSRAATELNRRLVEGKRVVLELVPEHNGGYNRVPAYVRAGDTFVNAELVRQGLAMAVDYGNGGKYTNLFYSLQQEAMSFNRGIWRYAIAPTSSTTQIVSGTSEQRYITSPGADTMTL